MTSTHDTTTATTTASGDPDTEADLVMRRCDELARYSSMEGGIERIYLSPQHKQVDAIADAWMREAGLSTRMDAAGSRIGRLQGARPGLPTLVLGSHLDTVPDAGRYDGILGVLISIAVANRLRARASELPFDIDVYAFHEEEGVRFGATLLGSRALAGTWSDDLWSLTDAQGVSLEQAFRDFGLDPARIGDAARRRDELVGYLEVHIEQGPHLEAAGLELGVVTSIAGARRFEITITGEPRHAGGTPYPRRKDALVGASEAVVAIERLGRANDAMATVGQMHVSPGAVNIVPGQARFSLDLRAETDAIRDHAWQLIERELDAICARRGLQLDVHQIHGAHSVACDPHLQQAIAAGIVEATGRRDQPMAMWSRAGHDAMAVADVTGIAMLFTRCHDGISHAPEESVLVEDVAVAIDAFEAAVWQVAEQVRAALASSSAAGDELEA